MLRYAQRVPASARAHVHNRTSVRYFRAIPDSSFNDVQAQLARDYRANRLTSMRASRANAGDNRVRIPFATEPASRVHTAGFEDLYIHQGNRYVYSDLSVYLHAMQPIVRGAVTNAFRRWRGVGFKLAVGIIYASNGGGGPDDEYEETMWSKPFYVFTYGDLDRKVAEMLADIEARSLLFYEQGSDKIIVEINMRSQLKLWKQDLVP
jgi:hypothetical protein